MRLIEILIEKCLRYGDAAGNGACVCNWANWGSWDGGGGGGGAGVDPLFLISTENKKKIMKYEKNRIFEEIN